MGLGIDYDDLHRHVYLVAPTQHGKSTLGRNLFIQLYRKGDCSLLFVDPKGDDSLKLLRELPDLDRVRFLDAGRGGFALNPLHLPPYAPGERDRAVTVWTGVVSDLISEFMRADQLTQAPRCSRIIQTLLYAIYAKRDDPVFSDIVDLARTFSSGDKGARAAVLAHLSSLLPERQFDDLRQELEAISGMEKTAFDPVLTRLSKFTVLPLLQRLFNVREGNVDFLHRLDPGQLTVVRVVPEDVGAHLVPLIMSSVVAGYWFNLQYKHALTRRPVRAVAFLDEFQDLHSLNLVKPMLAKSASFGLSLILSHQNMSQLDRDTLKTILGNAGLQIVGRLGSDDALTVARTWEPGMSAEVCDAISHLPPFRFLVRRLARPGEEAPLPVEHGSLPPPPEARATVDPWVAEQSKKLGYGEPATSMFRTITADVKPFEHFLPRGLPSETEWRLLCAIRAGPSSYSNVLTRAALQRNRETKRIWSGLVARHVVVTERVRHGTTYYKLSRGAVRDFFEPDFSKVAPSGEGQRIARLAFERHLNPDTFVSAAVQRPGEEAPDLVSYSYATRSATAVEVESSVEVRTHPEQIRRNIKKFGRLGFDRVEVWAAKRNVPRLKALLGKLVEIKGV